MKQRARTLLLALVVLAFTGGILAFRANKNNAIKFCTLTTLGHHAGDSCSGYWFSVRLTFNPTVKTVYYTTTYNTGNCVHVTCPTTGTFPFDN